MIADISGLVGRSFAAESNNVARMQRIRDGALRADWKQKPSAADKAELEAWLIDVLDVPVNLTVNLTVHSGRKTEAEAVARWKRNLENGD